MTRPQKDRYRLAILRHTNRVRYKKAVLAVAKANLDDVLRYMLSLACIESDTHLLKEVFQKYPSKINISGSEGGNPLLIGAACDGNLPVITVLLSFGADVNIRNDVGQTPVMTASKRGNLEIVKLLKERGADLLLEDFNGQTALHWAVTEKDTPDICDYLIRNGLNPNRRTMQGLSALDYAKRLNLKNSFQRMAELSSGG